MDAMTPRAGSTAARVTAVASALTTLAALAFGIGVDAAIAAAGEAGAVAPGWVGLSTCLMGVAGALVLWRVGWHPLAVVLVVFGALGAVFGVASAVVNASVALWEPGAVAVVALTINQRLYELIMVAIPLVLVLFPDGRWPARPALRVTAVAAVAFVFLAMAGSVLKPWRILAATDGGLDPRVASWVRDPWGIDLPLATWEAIDAVRDVLLVVGLALSIVVLVARRIGAGDELRRQLRWIAWAGGVLVLVLVAGPAVMPWIVAQFALIGAIAVVCVALVIAVTRHRLERIDAVIGWTLLYGALVAAVVLVDVVLLAVVGGILGESTVAVVAAVVVLLAFAPLREPLLAWIRRLVYGRRGDPYGVVAGLADNLEHSGDADDQLDHVVRSVARAFATPYVAVRVDQPGGAQLVARHGTPQSDTVTLPLTYRGEAIGELELAPPRRARLSRRDERLLADVVRQAAAAVRATVLNTELQRSREELVVAREEERQRLRRDVHDGLGPALAAVKVHIDAARNVAATDPERADHILEVASRTVTDAVGDIRRIVHDLRPPTLDDLGLRRALERVCESWDGSGPAVTLEYALGETPPPAVEVAIYRIASEAIANARRHAGAQRIRLAVTETDAAVVVEVGDDGSGIDPSAPAGVGLRSMRERAGELGGEFAVSSGRAGTTIRAVIPRPRASREAARV